MAVCFALQGVIFHDAGRVGSQARHLLQMAKIDVCQFVAERMALLYWRDGFVHQNEIFRRPPDRGSSARLHREGDALDPDGSSVVSHWGSSLLELTGCFEFNKNSTPFQKVPKNY